MSRPRPYRAVAFIPDPTAPNGRRRTVAGRTAACSPDGLAAFIAKHTAAGNAVTCFRVLSIEDVL